MGEDQQDTAAGNILYSIYKKIILNFQNLCMIGHAEVFCCKAWHKSSVLISC